MERRVGDVVEVVWGGGEGVGFSPHMLKAPNPSLSLHLSGECTGRVTFDVFANRAAVKAGPIL